MSLAHARAAAAFWRAVEWSNNSANWPIPDGADPVDEAWERLVGVFGAKGAQQIAAVVHGARVAPCEDAYGYAQPKTVHRWANRLIKRGLRAVGGAS